MLISWCVSLPGLLLQNITNVVVKQQKLVSRFRRPEVGDQEVNRVGSFWGLWGRPCLLLREFHAFFLASGSSLAIFDGPWILLNHFHFCLHLHKAFSLGVYLQISPLYKDNSHTGIRANPKYLILTQWALWRPCLHRGSGAEVLVVRTSTYEFEGYKSVSHCWFGTAPAAVLRHHITSQAINQNIQNKQLNVLSKLIQDKFKRYCK